MPRPGLGLLGTCGSGARRWFSASCSGQSFRAPGARGRARRQEPGRRRWELLGLPGGGGALGQWEGGLGANSKFRDRVAGRLAGVCVWGGGGGEGWLVAAGVGGEAVRRGLEVGWGPHHMCLLRPCRGLRLHSWGRGGHRRAWKDLIPAMRRLDRLDSEVGTGRRWGSRCRPHRAGAKGHRGRRAAVLSSPGPGRPGVNSPVALGPGTGVGTELGRSWWSPGWRAGQDLVQGM